MDLGFYHHGEPAQCFGNPDSLVGGKSHPSLGHGFACPRGSIIAHGGGESKRRRPRTREGGPPRHTAPSSWQGSPWPTSADSRRGLPSHPGAVDVGMVWDYVENQLPAFREHVQQVLAASRTWCAHPVKLCNRGLQTRRQARTQMEPRNQC